LTSAADTCPSCLATLPVEPRQRSGRPKRLDLSDVSTDGQAKALQELAMAEPDPNATCTIHEGAESRGTCRACGNPACAVCLSHGGTCPACRRAEAPAKIIDLSRQIAFVSGVSALLLFVFVAYRYLDKTVLDVDARRSALAIVLAVVHVPAGIAVVTRRQFALAVVATGLVLMGLLVPLLGAEPWWMAFVRLGAASHAALAAYRLKKQTDELYLPLNRTE